MKTSIALLIPAGCAALFLAQTQHPSLAALGQDTPYAVVERGAHHRTWERIEYELSPDGQSVPKVHRYTELATGMHRFDHDTGQFVDAKAEIEAFPGGAVARQGQHSVIFANNLATPGAIDLQAPDGKEFRSHILGLSYFDSATGKHVLFAEIKDCEGTIDSGARNQVLYRDAFTDIRASVRYTYTIYGLEQDILLEEAPPPPEAYGLSSASTQLGVVSEFLDPPTPTITPAPRGADGDPSPPDCNLDFGAMKIGRGKALFLGTSPDAKAVPVTKQWIEIDGRHLLIEQIPVPAFQEELKTLPRAGGASLEPVTNSVRHWVSTRRLLPAARLAQSSPQPMTVARVSLPPKALLLDYITMASSATDYTFLAGTTYYISGLVNLSGVTTLEGGCVLKFPLSTAASIVTTNVVCRTRPYCPVILTASPDSSYGEAVGGGSISGYYGKIALDLSGAPAGQVLSNLRFCYLSNAVAGANITLQNAQIIDCQTIFASGSTQPTLNNVLAYRTGTLLANSAAAKVTAAHLTAHYCTNFVADTTGTVQLTNCLFVCVTNWQCATTRTNASVFLNSDAGVFQTVGGGGHYLASDSPYRNAGTTNVNSSVLADIRTKTTYPPIVLSNVTLSADTTFSPQAQRDTDTPDLGFGYDPIDYAFGGVTANSNLTFTAGTVAGWFRVASGWYHTGHGIHLGDGTTATFDGRAEAPTWWVRTCAAQEGGNGLWQGGYGPGGITGWTTSSFAQAPRLKMRFTRCSTGADYTNPFRDDNGYLAVNASHSEFYSPGVGGYLIALNFTNCLFERVNVWTSWNNNTGDDSTNCAIRFRNCTQRGGSVGLVRASYTTPKKWAPWLVRDTILDGTTLSTMNDGAGGAAAVTDFNYNAFLTGAPRLVPNGANDVLVSGSFNWQTSWLGNYYLPSNSPVIDQGSATANLLGLYHFTTQTNQVKELSSQVDLGFHRPAINGPVDTVWVEDALPAGAVPYTYGGDAWTWISGNPTPFSGSLAHQSAVANGLHQQYFAYATDTLAIDTADSLVAYVYLDPAAVPSEVMLQWNDGASWEHRAYWGANNIAWGTDGTASRRYMGALPASGQWVRLEVTASQVGLEGATLSGMAFTLYNGRATWDYAGKSGGTSCFDSDGDSLPDYLEDANLNGNWDSDAGETDWRVSENGTTGIAGLQVFTPLRPN